MPLEAVRRNMNCMATRIAIIPARGGSKRIPHKNVRSFGGRPIISYVLDAARRSELFEVIHVSTEDAQIRSTVEGLGYAIDFPRPENLADDFTPIMPVLKYVVDTYATRGRVFDEAWLLMACAPFVTSGDLIEAAGLFQEKGGRQPLLAVSAYPVPVEWAYTRAHDGTLRAMNPGLFASRSQDLEKKYFDAGAFAAFPTDIVRSSHGTGPGDGFIGYVLDRHKAIDIDDEDDWTFAESMPRGLQSGD